MKILIERKDEHIGVFNDFRNIKDRGEISHFIVELELAKNELLKIWNKYEDETN